MELPLFLFSVVFYGSTVAQIRIQPPDGDTLEEGDELSLSCVLEDPSFTHINWFKESLKISKESLKISKENLKISEGSTSLIPDEYNVTHSSTRTDGLQQYVLHVQSVTKYNHGVYKCKASMQNGIQSRPKKYELNVLYQPHFKYPLCNFTISEQLANCESEKGNPEILLQWHHQSTVSNSFVAIESHNINVNNFMHKQTVYMYNFQSPLDFDDSIVCVLPTQPERNCSVSLRDVYESFDPPTISSNMTVLATESANVSCSTNLNLANDEFMFQYETFPHNRSLVIVQDDRSIIFTAIPVGIERIQISCLFKWGIFDSPKSDLTFITVIQPTTTRNPLETSRKVNLRTTPSTTTPSLLSQGQLPTQIPTTQAFTTLFDPKNDIPDLTTLELIKTDHQEQISPQTYSQSPKMSSVPPSFFRNEWSEYVSDGISGTSSLSTELEMLPIDRLTTGKLTTMQNVETVTSQSNVKTNITETNDLNDLSTQFDRLSTLSGSTLWNKLLTKITEANEIKSTPPVTLDTIPPEELATKFSATNGFTTAHDSTTNPLGDLMTKAETPSVPRHLSTEVHDFPSQSPSHRIVPSKATTVISTSSKVTSAETSPHRMTSPHQGSSSEQGAILSLSTKETPKLTLPHDKTKNNDNYDKNNDKKDNSVIYIIIICCSGVTLIMIGICMIRRKAQSGEYKVDT